MIELTSLTDIIYFGTGVVYACCFVAGYVAGLK